MKKLTLSSFRADPSLIEAQAKMQKTRAFQIMLEVLMSELPSHHALPFGSNGEDFACAHGMEVGYLRCIETIRLLSDTETGEGEPVPDFNETNND